MTAREVLLDCTIAERRLALVRFTFMYRQGLKGLIPIMARNSLRLWQYSSINRSVDPVRIANLINKPKTADLADLFALAPMILKILISLGACAGARLRYRLTRSNLNPQRNTVLVIEKPKRGIGIGNSLIS